MAAFCVGDVHACLDELQRLLELMRFNPGRDRLYLTGDLIGRGPFPVETMDFIMRLALEKRCCAAVLGNHDLNLIAVHYGLGRIKGSYNLEPLLRSPRRGAIIEFLCSLPLLYLDPGRRAAVCHAGVYPSWGLAEARAHSETIGRLLAHPQRRRLLLRNMYSDYPAAYREDLSDLCKWRFTVNAFTRMRLCSRGLRLDFARRALTPGEAARQSLFPWFDFGEPPSLDGIEYQLYFGHWATLNGQCLRPRFTALDTGCVWGNRLTGVCLETGERFEVRSGVKSG